jgi:hypothetical protein
MRCLSCGNYRDRGVRGFFKRSDLTQSDSSSESSSDSEVVPVNQIEVSSVDSTASDISDVSQAEELPPAESQGIAEPVSFNMPSEMRGVYLIAGVDYLSDGQLDSTKIRRRSTARSVLQKR